MKGGWVYIMSNRPNGTPDVGVTADIGRRAHEHRGGSGSLLTRRYKLHSLVWFEHHHDIGSAIQRETNTKYWPRARKVRLIGRDNPDWADLFPALVE